MEQKKSAEQGTAAEGEMAPETPDQVAPAANAEDTRRTPTAGTAVGNWRAEQLLFKVSLYR